MTPLEEFEVTANHLEETVEKMALLVLTFRRLLRELQTEKADFDFMAGTLPQTKKN